MNILKTEMKNTYVTTFSLTCNIRGTYFTLKAIVTDSIKYIVDKLHVSQPS